MITKRRITKKIIINMIVRSITSLVAALFLMSGTAQALTAQYPLKISADNRHLEDQAGIPFLLNSTSSWGLIVGLTKVEAEQYLEDRRARGFNSVMVMLLARHPQTHGPSNMDGEFPFLPLDDFSQPNELYFQHADWVIKKAAEKGMLVLLAPAYLGYNCGGEGWCIQMKATPLTELRAYGNYIGNRYKDYKNIIWLHGGDADAAAWGALGHVNAVAQGIVETDAPGRLNTAHCNRQNSAIDCYNESWLNLNTTYSGCQLSAAKTKIDYQRLPVFPSLYVEGVYENLGANERCLRSQAYWPLLGGLTGQVFGNDPIWKFASGWQVAQDSIGSRSMTHFANLFASRPWSRLVPDYAETIVSGNRGNINSSDYIMAARASDGSVIMAYMPNGRTVTVDMSTVAGSTAKAWWYNPKNGTSKYVGKFTTSGSKDFTPADTSDWVLVIDNADLGFPPPGEAGAVLPTQCADGIDNDADGLTDYPADSGCISALDNDELNPPSAAPAQCADGIDNDADGLTDYPADPGCISALDNDELNPPTAAPAQCADGIDNDADGLTDYPADPGCISALDNDELNPPSAAPAQCADGIDNDFDGLTDYPADSGCISALDSNELNPPSAAAPAQCEDGIDNDADGLTDFPADPGCISALDNGEFSQPLLALSQCEDGIDNDADGFTDLADLGCINALDNDEFNPPAPALAQCEDGIDNDADGFTDLADRGCSDVSDDNESDEPSQSNSTKSGDSSRESLQSDIAESGSSSLEPFTLLLLFCAFVVLRRRAGVS